MNNCGIASRSIQIAGRYRFFASGGTHKQSEGPLISRFATASPQGEADALLLPSPWGGKASCRRRGRKKAARFFRLPRRWWADSEAGPPTANAARRTGGIRRSPASRMTDEGPPAALVMASRSGAESKDLDKGLQINDFFKDSSSFHSSE